MTTDINRNKGLVVALACALLAMLVLLVAWRMMAKDTQARVADCRAVIAQYSGITKQHQGEPGSALAGLYDQKLKESQDAADEMRTAVVEAPAPKSNPNGFKELVRKTVDEMVPAFKAKNTPVPDDLGFTTIYSGHDLPSDNEMPKLIGQYLVISDVASVLLSNPIVKVEGIDRNPEVGGGGSGGNEPPEPDNPSARSRKAVVQTKAVFENVPVLFKFTTTPDTLYGIVAGIRNKSHFYRVRTLKTTMEPAAKGEAKDPSDIREDMAVEMMVERIVLLQDTPRDDAGGTKEKR